MLLTVLGRDLKPQTLPELIWARNTAECWTRCRRGLQIELVSSSGSNG